jgi:D-alanine--poly(phosphoribitol) ligase subunit 1
MYSDYKYNLGLSFYSVAAEVPDKIAICFTRDGGITFRELNRMSNRIARYLLNRNINKNNVIGIFNTKTRESFALMLACLKIGALYVNLDNTSPYERLRKIIERCNPVLLAYDEKSFLASIMKFKIPILDLSGSFCSELMTFSDSNLTITDSVCGDNAAYIMFTSGSTGFPKGAVMTHHNLINFIKWAKITYQINQTDILTNVNPMFFDNSVFDFYASIFNGAAMAPVDSETVKNGQKLVAYIDYIRATIWFSVPSLLIFLISMKTLTKDVFKSLRVITFGGEGFPKPKLKYLFDLYSTRIRIVNVYGPTECTCICSAYDISEADFKDMINLAPLGFLAPNFDFLILDENNKESGTGELVLGGPQVGLGYYNDPDRTRNSFVQHPLIKGFEKICYKTGDIVKKDNKGIIHIIGRADNQIKHMGYRIELEEIEAGFNTLEYINETGAVYERWEDGLGQIKAYVTLNYLISKEKIKEDIRKILPPYMIPRIITIMDTIPKNQNGKIDRVALKNYE